MDWRPRLLIPTQNWRGERTFAVHTKNRGSKPSDPNRSRINKHTLESSTTATPQEWLLKNMIIPESVARLLKTSDLSLGSRIHHAPRAYMNNYKWDKTLSQPRRLWQLYHLSPQSVSPKRIFPCGGDTRVSQQDELMVTYSTSNFIYRRLSRWASWKSEHITITMRVTRGLSYLDEFQFIRLGRAPQASVNIVR